MIKSKTEGVGISYFTNSPSYYILIPVSRAEIIPFYIDLLLSSVMYKYEQKDPFWGFKLGYATTVSLTVRYRNICIS